MPYSIEHNINVFLSYAHEDQAIADAIANMMRTAFFGVFDITMMSEFPVGVNWRQLIDRTANATDIMIAIATGRLKPGHSFMGQEIGSFTTSMTFKPNMTIAPNVSRRMIPFAVLDKTPETVKDYEGIDIDRSALHALRFDVSNTSREIQKLSSKGADKATKSVVKFLSDIQDLIIEILPEKSSKTNLGPDRIEFFKTLAVTFCQQVFSDLSNREESVDIPKSKLIIRVAPNAAPDQVPVSNTTVETQGPCYDSFGLSQDQLYDWSNFLKCASSTDIANSWTEAFRELLAATNSSEFVENNTILSFDRKKMFRIFVARSITLFSGAREYHVYVIPLLKPKDEGDPETTMLLKALQVSLGYRFLFLEAGSQFSPSLMRSMRPAKLEKAVSTMQNALNILLQTADDAGLNDPTSLFTIFGEEDVDPIYELWDKEKNALYQSASDVLVGPASLSLKSAFVTQLETFCEHTEEMNRRYTTRVMEVLQDRIKGTTGDPSANKARRTVQSVLRSSKGKRLKTSRKKTAGSQRKAG